MDVSAQLAALAEPTRRSIFEAVSKQPRSVAELSTRFPISRPAVSQHLKVLQDARLLRYDRNGTRNIYEIDPAGVATLRAYLDGLWTQALRDLKTLAESTYAKPKRRSQR